jgi:hypothetical protein
MTSRVVPGGLDLHLAGHHHQRRRQTLTLLNTTLNAALVNHGTLLVRAANSSTAR